MYKFSTLILEYSLCCTFYFNTNNTLNNMSNILKCYHIPVIFYLFLLFKDAVNAEHIFGHKDFAKHARNKNYFLYNM